jgi:hypothetical protein
MTINGIPQINNELSNEIQNWDCYCYKTGGALSDNFPVSGLGKY